MSIISALFGRPLATSESREQEIGVLSAVPVLGLDALSSAAYGPEAALAILIPAGVLGLEYLPAIIEFLGYNPPPAAKTLGERLVRHRPWQKGCEQRRHAD